jgi:hypothetical protein
MKTIGAFARECLKEWWGLMSCAAFTFLGIYIAAGNKGNASVVNSSAALGFVLLFVASYRAWKRQYEARCKAEDN